MYMGNITTALIDELGGYEACSLSLPNYGRVIREDKVEPLTDLVMQLIGDLVATLIDAGSEREAVEENDLLRDQIRNELNDWTEG